jgi:hypothetical protein
MTKFRLLLFSGAAVGLLGSATAAFGAPLLPDLHPVVLRDGDNPAYYVDVASQPGKTLVRFPTHTDNLGAGAFQVSAVAQTGTHTASAQQVIADSDPATPATIRPLSDLFVNDTGSETWDLQGIAKYTLTPTAGGAPVTSALTAMCVSDGDTAIVPPPAAVFTAVCRDQAFDPAGETVGISPNYFDAYATLSDHTQNYFALTGAAAAPGTSYTMSAMVNPGVTGGVDTAGRIQESNYTNNSDTSPGQVVIPGVAAADVAGGTAQGATPLTIKLGTAVTVTAPGTKVGTPSTVPAADTGARTFQIVTQPTKGTATVDPATGVITYKATSGQSGADQLTWKATDSRGLVSNVAKVTLNVVAPPPAPSAGGGTTPSGGGSVTPISAPSGGGSTTPVVVTPPPGGGATVGPKLAFAAGFSHGKLVVSFTPKATGTAKLTAKSGKTTVATCRTGVTAGKKATCKLSIAKRFAGKKLTISATLQPRTGLAGAAVLHSVKVPAAR